MLDQPWAVWDKNAKPVRGGIFRVATEQYIGKMNPNHWPVLDWVTMGYFHERLMFTDGNYNPTVPWLAEKLSWETPQDVVMKLREGVTFHDGSPFDAKAVKYQIDWIRDPASKTWDAGWLAQLDTVEVVDDSTLRWKFKTPWAGFTGVMANVPGYVLSAKALQDDVDKYDVQPQGTGPFMLEEASPGNFVKLKRNPNWWFAKASGNPDMPYFDGILVTIIPDPAVRLANLRAGKIDVLVLDKSQYSGRQDRSRAQRLPLPRQSRRRGSLQHHQERVPGHSFEESGQPCDRPPGADRRHAVRSRAAGELHVSGRPLVS